MNAEKPIMPTLPMALVTVINLLALTGLTTRCFVLLVEPFLAPFFAGLKEDLSLFAFLGGLFGTAFFCLLLLVVYSSVFKRRIGAAGVMPVLYIIAGVLCLFGISISIAALSAGGRPDEALIIRLALIGAIITAYFFLCAILASRWRYRLQQETDSRGTFPEQKTYSQ